jgi:hypothetical protein
VTILSRVRDSVTNNNGFWIGWLDLLHLMHSHSSGLHVIQRYHYSTPWAPDGARHQDWLTDWLTDHQSQCDFDYSTHFQFTVVHALGFSVFTDHILATDLSQYHCNFKSHMNSSCRPLIPFLPFLQLPILRLDSVVLYTPLYSVYCYNSCPAEHFL